MQTFITVINSTLPSHHKMLYVVYLNNKDEIEYIVTFEDGKLCKKNYSVNDMIETNETIETKDKLQKYPNVVIGKNIPLPEYEHREKHKTVAFKDDVSEVAPSQNNSVIDENQRLIQLKNKYKSIEKKEAELVELLKREEFNAIKLTCVDYKNFLQITDKATARKTYAIMNDMTNSENCLKLLEELVTVNLDEMFFKNEHNLSPALIEMCKRYKKEMSSVKINFDHKWNAFESDVPVNSTIQIKTNSKM